MGKKSSELRSLQNRILGVTMPISRKRTKWGRNWPCLCGRGKKYKNCCMVDIDRLSSKDGNATVVELSKDIQKMIEAHRAAMEAEAVESVKGGVEQNG